MTSDNLVTPRSRLFPDGAFAGVAEVAGKRYAHALPSTSLPGRALGRPRFAGVASLSFARRCRPISACLVRSLIQGLGGHGRRRRNCVVVAILVSGSSCGRELASLARPRCAAPPPSTTLLQPELMPLRRIFPPLIKPDHHPQPTAGPMMADSDSDIEPLAPTLAEVGATRAELALQAPMSTRGGV